MTLVWNSWSKVIALQSLIDGAAFDVANLRLRLFSNDIDPDHLTPIEDFVETTFGGYSAHTWTTQPTAALSSVDYRAYVEWEEKVWTIGPPGTPDWVYGYYVTDAAGTTLYWSERNPAGGVYISMMGQTYSVAAKMTLTNEPHP